MTFIALAEDTLVTPFMGILDFSQNKYPKLSHILHTERLTPECVRLLGRTGRQVEKDEQWICQAG